MHTAPPAQKKVRSLPEDYFSCAQFDQSRFIKFDDPTSFILVKIFAFMVNMMIMANIARFYLLQDILVLEAGWAVMLANMSFIWTIPASQKESKATSQEGAVIFVEVAHAFNLFVCAAFWLTEASSVFPKIPDSLSGTMFKIYLISVHTIPVITSTGQIVLTRMYLLKKDWMKVCVAGLAYMVCSGFITFLAGHPISTFAPLAKCLRIGPATVRCKTFGGLPRTTH